MAKKKYDKLRIFLASPGDVTEERDRVDAIARELNQTGNLADSLGLTLEVLDWRSHVSPAMGRPEGEIITQLPVESWDIFVGILWLRFGSRTGGKDPTTGRDYDSGTGEEFRLAYLSWEKNKRPQILFYRGDKQVNPTQIDMEQYRKVDKFFRQFFPDGEHPGLYSKYKDTVDFERKVRNDLNKILLKYGKEVLKKNPTKSRRKKRTSTRNLGDLTQKYLDFVYDQHGHIRLFGFVSPRANIDVSTTNVFVSLSFSDPTRAMHLGKVTKKQAQFEPMTPARVLEKGSRARKPLLILGGPGYGKTTLLKYYAVCCRTPEGRQRLALQRPLIPIFIPLRQVDPNKPFTKFLHDWAKKNKQDISATISETVFKNWLKEPGALVLLDGLDEVSELETRKKICRWIDAAIRSFKRSIFVITCRHTGYHELAGGDNDKKTNPFETNPLQYDVLSLSEEQQETFLWQWFDAAKLVKLESYELENQQLRQRIREQAKKEAESVMDHLRLEENKSLLDLGKIPVLLQIIAIIWREQGKSGLSGERSDLYRRSIDYLLQHREEEKGMPLLLSAPKAQLVLRPLALWMQEVHKKDEASAEKVVQQITEPLSRVKPGLEPMTFLGNIRDRAGVLVGSGADNYMFQHRSFREYLAAIEIANKNRVELLVDNFGDPWWQDTVLFSAGITSPVIFPEFLRRFLKHEKNKGSTPPLLLQMMQESAVKPLDPFQEVIPHRDLDWPFRYNALQCLRFMRSDEAIGLIKSVLKDPQHNVRNLAEDILFEWNVPNILISSVASFRNPIEGNAEYILIPGGTFKYSVTKTETEVPPLYFAKYPVPNKLYRMFIDYLAGQGKQLDSAYLSREEFVSSLIKKAKKEIKGFLAYLGPEPKTWPKKLRSEFDDDKRFNGDDQPVIGITWYGAVAYCHWLTEMHARLRAERGETERKLLFRLPKEEEWEWAAAGREKNGQLRPYPWGAPKPDDSRANYGQKEGQTTPVGSYPAGATPEGLMDMAGNVWEWMETSDPKNPDARALRGGSWDDRADDLRCVARYWLDPHYCWVNLGFRVLCVQS